MTEIKGKKLLGFYQSYCRSTEYNIFQAYNRPSDAKIRAFDYCLDLMSKLDGHGIRIVGHNCMTFSAGFEFEKDGRRYYCHITPTYDYWGYVE